MSYSSSIYSLLLPICILFILLSSIGLVTGACYSHFFSFGDSIVDTGNVAIFPSPIPNGLTVTRFPYGETFFHNATGRWSDGRLIVDFIAEALKMPLPIPNLAGKTAKDFQYGANFAFSGATMLNLSVYTKMGLNTSLIAPFSLDVQMKEFKKVLKLLGSTHEEREKIMSGSLVLIGGGDDYNDPFFQNRSLSEIKPLVPRVINAFRQSIEVLIKLGGKTFVLPGFFPLGCHPRYLTLFQSKNQNDYDGYGCLRWLNDFAQFHNGALKSMLKTISVGHPGVTVSYADNFRATWDIMVDPTRLGFAMERTLLRGCCGDGGPFNSNSLFACGSPGYNFCSDPSKYISWDGLHFTEHAHQLLANGILNGPYASPPILSTCKVY